MKRETAEQWILLDQSGELGPIRRRLLKRHLAQHPELRSYQDDALRLARDLREANDIPPISAQTMAAIRVAADQHVPAGAGFHWQPVFALAAVALLVTAGWLVMQRAPASQVADVPVADAAELAWDDNLDTEIKALNAMYASASSDIEFTEKTDAESIATELLQLEGSTI